MHIRFLLVTIILCSFALQGEAQWQSFLRLGYQYQIYDGYDNINNIAIGASFNKINEESKRSADHSFLLYSVNVNDDFNLFAEYNPSLNLSVGDKSRFHLGPYIAYNLSNMFLEYTKFNGDFGISTSFDFIDDPISLKLYFKKGFKRLKRGGFAHYYQSYRQSILGVSLGIQLKEY